MTDRTLEKVFYTLLWLMVFMGACVVFTYSLLTQFNTPFTLKSVSTVVGAGIATVAAAYAFMRTIVRQWL